MSTEAIRTPGGKWHRGGRYDYPGKHHCPTGLGFVLMPRGCEVKPLHQTRAADRCRRCFPDTEPNVRHGLRCLTHPCADCLAELAAPVPARPVPAPARDADTEPEEDQ